METPPLSDSPTIEEQQQQHQAQIAAMMQGLLNNNAVVPPVVPQVPAIHCNGCKSNETATSFCQDCTANLCDNCTMAHKYMHCFADHRVVELTPAGSSASSTTSSTPSSSDSERSQILASFGGKHSPQAAAAMMLLGNGKRPVLCLQHRASELVFFCVTCNLAICRDCTQADHPAGTHQYELISDVDSKQQILTASLHNAHAQLDETVSTLLQAIQEQKKQLSKKIDNAFAAKPPAKQGLWRIIAISWTVHLGVEPVGSVGGLLEGGNVDEEKFQTLFPPSRSQIKRQKMIYHCKFGEFGVMEGQFTEPSGVAVNGQGDIVVADTNNHRIQVFDKDGRFKFQFGECGKRDGQLLYPNRVAVNRTTGNFVVTERSPTHQIQVYNQYGQFLRKFGANILQHPRGVCVDNKGRIIVVECKVMRVIIFDMFGNILRKFSCSRYLEFPNGVCTNDKNEILISDNRAHCIKVFSYEGQYLRQIGGEGVTNYPIGVGINSLGEVVVADNHNNFNLTVFSQRPLPSDVLLPRS
ncbi:unnamed protein product [Caenorhabditis nigoni]